MRQTTLNRERLAPSVRMTNSARWESIDFHNDIVEQAVPPSASETAYAVTELVRKVLYSIDLHNSDACTHALVQIADYVRYPHNIRLNFTSPSPLSDDVLEVLTGLVDIDIIDWILSYALDNTNSKMEPRKRLVMLLWMIDYQHTTTKSKMARDYGLNYTDMGLILKEL